MENTISGPTVAAAVARAAERMEESRDYLNRLDAAVGDGDLGITASKGATAVREYLSANPPGGDLGKFFSQMGMAFNRAASSTMGTLIATALIRAGEEARGLASLDGATLARMLRAADAGIQDRGKAGLGDKTIIDAMHPAAETFAEAVEQGKDLGAGAAAMLQAAREGRDAVIPLRSKVGRAAWVGERTENQPDPGTVLFVEVLEAVLDADHTVPGSTIDGEASG
jgi:dihydroxyacetone kinase